MSDELEAAKANEDYEAAAKIKAKLAKRDQPQSEKAVDKK